MAKIKIYLISFLLVSCSSSKYYTVNICQLKIQNYDKVLAISLPEYTSWYQNDLKKQFSKFKGNITLAEEEEWNFKIAGITNPLDTTSFSKLQAKGYKFFLFTKLVNSKESKYPLMNYAPEELDFYNNPNFSDPGAEMENTAKIRFDLYSLQNQDTIYSLITESRINSIGNKNKDDSETFYNFSSVEAAKHLAFKKGIKKLLKSCR